MKMNKIFAMMLAAMAFVSCSNDDETITTPTVKGGSYDLSINLLREPTVRASFGMDTEEQAGVYAPITNVNIFVADNTGKIYARKKHTFPSVTTPTGTPPAASADIYSEEFKGIDASAKIVYVVANSDTDFSGSTYANLSDVKAVSYTFDSQNTTRNAGKVLLDGSATATTTNTFDNGSEKFEASVVVQPALARIEIKGVSKSADTDNTISSFVVDKVFINKYFNAMALTTGVGTSSVVNMIYDTDSPSYPTANLVATSVSDGVVVIEDGVTISSSKFAAFNFFTGEMPHILVKLKNITYTGTNTGLTEGWISIKTFKASGTAVSTSVKGTVYSVENIEFKNTDIGPDPYTKNINLTANIKVLPWVGVVLTPEL